MVRIIALSCLVAGLLPADSLYLRDGRVIHGTFVSGTARQVRFLVERGRTQNFPVTSIASVRFGDTAQSAAAPPAYRSGTQASQSQAALGTRARTANSIAVPEGTVVTVRTIDPINSDKSNIGDTFRASLDEPLIVNGRTLAPKGADAILRVVQVNRESGISGSEQVALELAEVTVNGRRYTASSEHAEVAAKNRNSESVKVIGGTAVLGAIIGAIAGGGKGAAIGAAAGAGTGAAIQAIRGQRVQIPAESLLDFRLSRPLYID